MERGKGADSLATVEKVFGEGEQTGESESWIDVMFDHVEREIVGAAKAPDDEDKENGCLQAEILGEKKRDRGGADHEEQKRFQVDRCFALQICHTYLDSGGE